MNLHLRRWLRIVPVAGALTASVALSGCNRAGMTTPQPISVSLPNPNVVVARGGAAVIAEIQIMSTSETAVVSFTGMPGDVQVQYSASDTSPSGDLKFTAGAAAKPGTYTPKITAMSAGATASTTFSLVVEK